MTDQLTEIREGIEIVVCNALDEAIKDCPDLDFSDECVNTHHGLMIDLVRDAVAKLTKPVPTPDPAEEFHSVNTMLRRHLADKTNGEILDMIWSGDYPRIPEAGVYAKRDDLIHLLDDPARSWWSLDGPTMISDDLYNRLKSEYEAVKDKIPSKLLEGRAES